MEMKGKRNTGKYKKHFLFFIPVLVLVCLDQLTKSLVRRNLSLGESIPVIGDFFRLVYVQNTGAGFGLLKGMNIFLIIVTLGFVSVLVFYYFKRIKLSEKMLLFSTAGVVAGGIGNLIDRLVFGFVIDFLDFAYWPAFNVADICVTAGVVGLVVYTLRK